MHTHLAVYQGEMVARIALGEDVKPDHRAIPHATYMEPQTAGVGLQLVDAHERGADAFEETADYATSAPDLEARAYEVDQPQRCGMGVGACSCRQLPC